MPEMQEAGDAIVRVTLSSICSSDLHIKHGSVPRAKPGVIVGHEMVGVVEQVGETVRGFRPGDRVAVNVETFCGECYFCRRGFVNNCTHVHGGWALGCRIDGARRNMSASPLQKMGSAIFRRASRMNRRFLPAIFWQPGIGARRSGKFRRGILCWCSAPADWPLHHGLCPAAPPGLHHCCGSFRGAACPGAAHGIAGSNG